MRDIFCPPQVAIALSLFVAGPLSGCGANDSRSYDHGAVFLELLPGQGQGGVNPYAGTAQIEATMLYRECLTSFYSMQPTYQQDGPIGAGIFGPEEDGGEGWKDHLCEVDRDDLADCTVEKFRQDIDATQEIAQLTVTYTMNGEVQYRDLPFGPIPKASLAQCGNNKKPIVRIGGTGSVRGLDGAGNTLWRTQTFDPAEAFTDQGASIKIRAAVN